MNKKEDITLFLAVEAMLNNSMRTLRSTQIMTVEDIAKLYEVTPQYLQQRVKKNPERFPKDFMFRLTKEEQDTLNTKYSLALTEGGVLMVGGQLRSEKARKIHMQVIDSFVRLYKKALQIKEVMEKLKEYKNNEDTNEIFTVLEQMISPKK